MSILKYFPDINSLQKEQFGKLRDLYEHWNSRINVISRKDIDNLYVNHVLHSLAIAKFCKFLPGTKILDIGTGGGFPGLPLAIMFSESKFLLVDSIEKKIKVVNEVSSALELPNLEAAKLRAESVQGKYDFVVSRAVAPMSELVKWSSDSIRKEGFNLVSNGFICLKGGDLTEELEAVSMHCQIIEISDYFDEEFFHTKKIVYSPVH